MMQLKGDRLLPSAPNFNVLWYHGNSPGMEIQHSVHRYQPGKMSPTLDNGSKFSEQSLSQGAVRR